MLFEEEKKKWEELSKKVDFWFESEEENEHCLERDSRIYVIGQNITIYMILKALSLSPLEVYVTLTLIFLFFY